MIDKLLRLLGSLESSPLCEHPPTNQNGPEGTEHPRPAWPWSTTKGHLSKYA